MYLFLMTQVVPVLSRVSLFRPHEQVEVTLDAALVFCSTSAMVKAIVLVTNSNGSVFLHFEYIASVPIQSNNAFCQKKKFTFFYIVT